MSIYQDWMDHVPVIDNMDPETWPCEEEKCECCCGEADGRIKIAVELCHENAKLPTYAHDGDAGFDIYLPEDFIIKAGEYGKIAKTGLKMAIPQGYELQIRPRSGNSVKTTLRISNSPGTVDAGYRDEIGVICDNIGEEDLLFKAGDRIAQGVLAQVPQGKFEQIEDIKKIAGDRNGGFGSTGK